MTSVHKRVGFAPLCQRYSAAPGWAHFPARGRIVAVALLLLLVTGIRAAHAQSGRDILQKVSDSYYHLATYQGTASVEVTFSYQGKVLPNTSYDQVEMEFKRPNLIKLTFTNPHGTRIVQSDGKNLYLYNGTVNQYNKLPTQQDTIKLIAELGLFQIQAIADPLYFLGIKGVPGALVSISQATSGAYNGKPVYIVSGVTRTQARTFKAKSGQVVHLPASQLNWKWWVNKKTYLLEKMEAEDRNATLPVAIKRGNKVTPQTLHVIQKIRHTVMTAQTNPPLTAKDFAFTPPSGATERKGIADLLKNGK